MRREAFVLHGVEDEFESLLVTDLRIFLLQLSSFGFLDTGEQWCQ